MSENKNELATTPMSDANQIALKSLRIAGKGMIVWLRSLKSYWIKSGLEFSNQMMLNGDIQRLIRTLWLHRYDADVAEFLSFEMTNALNSDNTTVESDPMDQKLYFIGPIDPKKLAFLIAFCRKHTIRLPEKLYWHAWEKPMLSIRFDPLADEVHIKCANLYVGLWLYRNFVISGSPVHEVVLRTVRVKSVSGKNQQIHELNEEVNATPSPKTQKE